MNERVGESTKDRKAKRRVKAESFLGNNLKTKIWTPVTERSFDGRPDSDVCRRHRLPDRVPTVACHIRSDTTVLAQRKQAAAQRLRLDAVCIGNTGSCCIAIHGNATAVGNDWCPLAVRTTRVVLALASERKGNHKEGQR